MSIPVLDALYNPRNYIDIDSLRVLETAAPNEYKKIAKIFFDTRRSLLALDLCTLTCPKFSIRGDVDLLKILKSKRLIFPYTRDFNVSLDMFAVMKEVETQLPTLLADKKKWNSLFIDYRPPHLMRIFCDLKSNILKGKTVRVNLHYFLPVTSSKLEKSQEQNDHMKACRDSGENLYHPHGWAACIHIVEGVYDQHIGFADQPGIDAVPRKLCSLTHKTGDRYSMSHPWLWHQVIPIPKQAVSTLMVTYIPKKWDQEVPRPTKSLRVLDKNELQFMLNHFKIFYS